MKLYSAVGAFIVAVFVVTALACGGSSSAQINLSGTWKSSDLPMVAHISNNSIEIDVVDNGDNTLYWKGTFDATKGSQTSQGDTKAMSKSILGSNSSTKQFNYTGNEISYKFSILGHARTVYLKR